jgi:hypothetical protein
MLKVLVCGGREFSDRDLVFKTLDAVLEKHGEKGVYIVHGACPTGADALAEEWAKSRQVAYIGIPAQWDAYGRSAGPMRNKRMRDEIKPDHCIAFRGGTGTRGMIDLMREVGVQPWLVRWSE